MPVAMTQNDQKYYLHYDQVGSLRAVSDSSNNIIKEITYDTYGNILSDSNEDFKVPFGFAGGLSDTDTNLTRFGYRDYDAYTGKWTAKDPIGFNGGDTNLYGYVLGDPVNFVDPEGLFFWNSDETLTKKEAEAAIKGARAYGKGSEMAIKSLAKKGVASLDNKNYRQYKACLSIYDKKKCETMYPHEKKEKGKTCD